MSWSILWWDLYLCQQHYFFFLKILRLDRRGGRWSEGRRTADFCFCPGLAVLELLTSFSLFFFICPNPELTGMLLCAFLNAPNVYDFLCKEPKLENKNRRVLKEEGSGRWLKWGPEGHRWEMGGECMLGGNVVRWESHMVLVTMTAMPFMFDSPVKQLYGTAKIDTMFNMLQQNKKTLPWGTKVLSN